LRLFPREEILEPALGTLAAEHREELGLVSADVPLISNLDILGNLALIKQYREDLPKREAESLVLSYLRRFDLERIAYRRNPDLSDGERFCAMLVRAILVPGAFVVIDRPLKIVPDLQDNRFFHRTLTKVADSWTSCVILDYLWNRERYEDIPVAVDES
jgi:ABC-type lipoprotein export system ATPase subunit